MWKNLRKPAAPSKLETEANHGNCQHTAFWELQQLTSGIVFPILLQHFKNMYVLDWRLPPWDLPISQKNAWACLALWCSWIKEFSTCFLMIIICIKCRTSLYNWAVSVACVGESHQTVNRTFYQRRKPWITVARIALNPLPKKQVILSASWNWCQIYWRNNLECKLSNDIQKFRRNGRMNAEYVTLLLEIDTLWGARSVHRSSLPTATP